jgi:vesicle coat complex subunit
LKHIKLEILKHVAIEENVKEIIDEISYYVTINDIDEKTSRKAIQTIGGIAVNITSATELAISNFLDFIDVKKEYIIAETFIVLKDILRMYTNDDFCKIFLPTLISSWKSLNDVDSTVAFVWILGEFGELLGKVKTKIQRNPPILWRVLLIILPNTTALLN